MKGVLWRVYWIDIFGSQNERVFTLYNKAMEYYYDVCDSPFSIRVHIFPLYEG